MIGRYLNGSYVNTVVVTIILLAFDFWSVKNVTGRLLVGLRWWNNVQEDGSSQWVFESHLDERALDPIDREVFWKATYSWCLLWIILFLVNLISLSLDWLLLVGMGVGFSVGNLIGFWKCSKDAQGRMLASFQNSMAQSMAVNSLFGAPPSSSGGHPNSGDSANQGNPMVNMGGK